jgi:DNA repair protein RecO (recombination protein O)
MRVKELGESDLLVTFFTRDKGRLRGIGKAARRSRRRFPNCLDLFCLVNMEYEMKKKGSLYFLHSCKLAQSFTGLRSDYAALSLASYMIELTELLFPLGVVDERMFDLLRHALESLERSGQTYAQVWFEAEAMHLGGYGIDLGRCCRCGRPYRGEGRAVFVPARGGIACLRCEPETPSTPGLAPEAVRSLGVMQKRTSAGEQEAPPTDGVLQEIGRVLKLHMDYRLGQRLKTARCVESFEEE